MANRSASEGFGAGQRAERRVSPGMLACKVDCVELADLGPEELKDILEDCVQLEGFVAAKRAEILAAFGTARSHDWRTDPGRQPADRIAENMSPYGADEIAPILDAAPRTAAAELHRSMRACSCLPRTVDALKTGSLSPRRYREVMTKTRDLPVATTLEADREITTWNPNVLPQSFRTRLSRWVGSHDTRTAESKHRDVCRDRAVEFIPDDNGSAQLLAYGPADSLRALFDKLDHAARTGRDTAGREPAGVLDTRTLAQRRFDALVDASVHHDDHRRVEAQDCRLNVTVPVFALLGWNDPGYLEGYGPIPASMARRLAAGAQTWTRLLTDPVTDRIINADPKKYRPNAALRKLVRARDGTCRFPSCNIPAGACDIDHINPFARGGPTTPENLQALCEHHHEAKTKGFINTNRHDRRRRDRKRHRHDDP
ncbi:HNH endonuclease signature motif containing protein [Spelaeicoccus albus]|uniref:HNH nuclease domain-containing protein n=1 Tax=Spelaeicoccus albus TaxID=1280376 RepID=A0A7Z0IHD1_9MICO|nr:HNH endonuclease signature motif containing protein [Spelaeicoccus albus]NYI67581.1 hypothetical protein [Spelaeicoccus albus]